MNDDILALKKTMEHYYTANGRHDMPWRQPEPSGAYDPYKILVSELMLQQTQVTRVMPKYEQFLGRFPDIGSLASAPLSEVLKLWQGLGYNRRAQYLHRTAQQVVSEYHGELPRDVSELIRLPGVGKNTAGAIVVYSFNKPAVFIETNIRTVIIYHCFRGHNELVHDKDIEVVMAELIAMAPDVRSLYYALMDYGTYLKQRVPSINKLSKSYVKQSAFHGSRRQLRGLVLRQLAERPRAAQELSLTARDERLEAVLKDLCHEGLICKRQNSYELAA